MTIFISVASYRDPELVNTLESAVANAANPYDIHFGVVYQGSQHEKPFMDHIKNISLVEMHPKDAQGAGYARNIAMTLYKDEDYFLQIDSHTRFAPMWDQIAIEELNKAKAISNNNKIILSYYPAAFVKDGNMDVIVDKSDRHATYPTKQMPYLNKDNKWSARRSEFEDAKRLYPELSGTVLGGFIFADGEIVKEVPYDPEISFFGEEICFAARAWTNGWDIYSPSKDIVYHFYIRAGYKKVWNDRNLRKMSWKELEDRSANKQKNVLSGIETGIFGLGKIRSMEDYEDFVGINFKEYYGLTND